MNCRLIVQGAILAAISCGDALTIKVAGIRNKADHQQLPAAFAARAEESWHERER